MGTRHATCIFLALLGGCAPTQADLAGMEGECGTTATTLAKTDASPLGFSAAELVDFLGARTGDLTWDFLDVGDSTLESRDDDPATGGEPLTASFALDAASIGSVEFIETPQASVGTGSCAASPEELDIRNVAADVELAGLSLADPTRAWSTASDLTDEAVMVGFGADLSDPTAIADTVAPLIPEGAVIQSAYLGCGGTLPTLGAGLEFTWLDPDTNEVQAATLHGTWTQRP